ncbi:MAG: carboxymuconolactone decarboxylase family protein [Chthoniobacterales bacterium]|jgi:AhpD family alkylhydroperoxidase
MNNPAEPLAAWQRDFSALRAQAPEVAKAFGGMHHATMQPGALTKREKELIAAAIGLAQGCTGCIHIHTAEAIKAGATREQVIEASGVAVMMGGGPAFVHLPEVLRALAPVQNAQTS